MNLMRIGVLLMLGVIVTGGCASPPPFPAGSLTGRIVEVKVGESLTPKEITAKPGDEIRWVNTTGTPADISFDQSLDGIVSCEKGFASAGWGYLFGSSEPDFLVIARLHGRGYVSLCFSTPGTYTYDLRTDKTATGKATRIGGAVRIE